MPAYLGPGKVRFEDNNGNPLSGGKVYVYEAGTVSTFVNVYDDYQNALDEISPQANPVVLNTRGEAIIIITQAVKLKVTDSDDNVIWTVDNVAIADGRALGDNVYHFASNSIVDLDGDAAFGFNAVDNANSYVIIDSKAASAPPVIRPFCEAVTDQDLILTPQNNGYITVKNKLKVDYSSTGGNQLVITGANTGGHPTITTEGFDATPNIVLNPKGSGIVDIQANTSITGTLSASGTAAFAAAATVGTTLGVTGAATFNNTIASGAITSTGAVQGTGIKLSNSGFTATINAPTLAGNRTWSWASADGANKSVLTTNGAGTLSFSPLTSAALAAYHSTTQSIPTGAASKVLFNTEIFDNMSFFSSSRYTPTIPGIYSVTFLGNIPTIEWTPICNRSSSLFHQQAVANQYTQCHTWLMECNGVGDWIEIWILHTDPGSVTLSNPKLFIHFVGD